MRESMISASPVHSPEDTIIMRPLNDVTVASDNLPGGLQNVTKHVLHGMVLGEITDGLHLQQQRDRFRNARTSFHRVVRRCQNQFWSDWQENLTSLSRVNPELQPRESDRCSVSVGSQSSGVFNEDFHDEVTRRFSALST